MEIWNISYGTSRMFRLNSEWPFSENKRNSYIGWIRKKTRIRPSYQFYDFSVKNDRQKWDLGFKMKILKFLGIQPIYGCSKMRKEAFDKSIDSWRNRIACRSDLENSNRYNTDSKTDWDFVLRMAHRTAKIRRVRPRPICRVRVPYCMTTHCPGRSFDLQLELSERVTHRWHNSVLLYQGDGEYLWLGSLRASSCWSLRFSRLKSLWNLWLWKLWYSEQSNLVEFL